VGTFITKGSENPCLMGSPEKRVDWAPGGVLWLCESEPAAGKFFSSSDGGSTWKYSAGSDLPWNIERATNQTQNFPTFFIDGEGYAHVAWSLWNTSPQRMNYARGRPVSGGGWSWTILRWAIVPNVGGDSEMTVVRRGSGWTVFIQSGSHGRVGRVEVSANGTLTLATAAMNAPDTGTYHSCAALEHEHIGDGKTPKENPHLLMVSGAQSTDNGMRPMWGFRALHNNGAYTWQAPVQLDAGADIHETSMSMLYDGTRVCTVYEYQAAPGVRFVEWIPGGAVTRRDPPTLPSDFTGVMLGVSIGQDIVTHDIWIAAYSFNSDIWWAKLTRSTNTWSAWTKIATRVESKWDGKIQIPRHAQRDTIDLIWATASPGANYPFSIYHEQIARLQRTPSAPALHRPANGARVDLAAGAMFEWDYMGTGPSDVQQAWAFRRVAGATTAYWNAGSQAWQSTEIFNAGAEERATFPPGAWPNGAAYSWTVRVKASSGQDSPYATPRSVIATSAPVVRITGPSGLVFTESTPTVTWDYVSSDAQRTYEVRVFVDAPNINPDTATPLWSSGQVTSSTGRAVRIDTPLLDGESYRIFARATSSTDLTSAWDDEIFTLSLTPPTGPSVRASQGWSYPRDVPHAVLRLVGRTNHLSSLQARGLAGWDAEPGTSLAFHEGDLLTLTEEGLALTTPTGGRVAARSVLGQPPEAPIGQPQPLGPLSFPVNPGETYTAIAHFRAATSTLRAARIVLRWYAGDEGLEANAPAAAMETTLGDQVNVGTAYDLVVTTVTAPQGAKRVTVVPEMLGLDAGETGYVSRLSFHPGDDTRWQPGGFATTQTLRVERSLDGIAWTQVDERVGVDFYQRGVVIDRLMPLGRDVLYRGFTDVNYDNGARLSSAPSPIATLAVEADAWAIRDPLDFAGEVNALVIEHERKDRDAATVSQPAGRSHAVVDSEGPMGAEGSLTIYAPAAIRDATVDLLRRGRALVVQSPVGVVHLVYFVDRDYTFEMNGARTLDASYVEVG
jgi:hypothetical protein